MDGTYNPWLVTLSFAVAILASYVALDLAARIKVTPSGFTARRFWVVGGAVSMGSGIWSMHFIGMLAFKLAMPMSYDFGLTFSSLLIAILAAGFALHIATGAKLGPGRLLGAGLVMGAGIASMHYVGMAAMLVHPPPRYDRPLFLLSILIAVAASVSALWIAFRMRDDSAHPPYRHKAASAVLMGVAIGGMHYTGMVAAMYSPGTMSVGGKLALDNVPLAIAIGAFTTILLAATLIIALLDRRFARDIARHEEVERALRASREEARAVVDTAYDAFAEINADGRVLEWTRQAESTFGWSRSEAIGREMVELVVPERDRVADAHGLEAFLAAHSWAISKRRIEMTARHRDGREFPIELTIWKVPVGDTYKFNSFLHDISERHRTSQRQLAQSVAAAALVSSASLEEAAPKVLKAICAALDWSVGVLWTVDPSERVLRCVDVCYPGDADKPVFEAASRSLTYAEGAGLPGRVWATAKSEWIADATRDPLYQRHESARHDELHAVVGFPIFSGGRVVAVAEFLSPSRQEPDPQLLQMMDNLTDLLGQFLARTEAEGALERERDFLGTLLDHLSEGIVACDENGNLTLFNRATRELHGMFDKSVPFSEWAKYYSLFHADGKTPMAPEEIPLMRALHGERIRNLELVIARSGHKPRTVVCSGQSLVTATGRKLGAVVAMHDMTERKEAEQRLQELAHFDPLTGLPNRRWFYKSLQSALVEGKEKGWVVAVLFLDLDRFKTVNDTLGHEVGDELLRQVGTRVEKIMRVRDVVARLGGDEFGVILVAPGDPQAAAVAAQKITKAFGAPFHLGGREVSMTASIGITIFPNDAEDSHTLIRYADTAMYEAKAAGRGGYRFYTAAMNARVQEKLELESALNKAIEKNQFELFYQPKIDIRSGRWVGVEGLLRWNRPGHGLVDPEQFIGVLEDTGLIVPVGEWVIDTACRQIHDWQIVGIPLGIAANVSAKQVMWAVKERYEDPAGERVQPSAEDPLSATISNCMRIHGVAPGLLDIELTESTLIIHAERTVGLLQNLKALGVDISIDDFGTGYSSLAYLRRFPIHTLKIDRQFISDVTSNPDDAAIAVAIIVMAHSLKLKVVAEGVETPEQLEFLRRNGCDQAQGYLIARPLKADAVARLWRNTQRRRSAPPGKRSA